MKKKITEANELCQKLFKEPLRVSHFVRFTAVINTEAHEFSATANTLEQAKELAAESLIKFYTTTCPHGHRIGIDFDGFSECDNCKEIKMCSIKNK